jgi:multiple sugar transport system permease protein
MATLPSGSAQALRPLARRPRGGTVGAFVEKRFPYILILPMLVAIFALIIFPLLYSLYYSFTSYKLLSAGSDKFIWLNNYWRLITRDDLFWKAFGNTLVFGLYAIHIEFLLGFGLAMLLNRRFPGFRVLRGIILIPYMVGGVLTGFQYRWFFNDQFGMFNNALISLGILNRQVAWLVEYPMASVVAASIWHTTPFVTMILLAGLSSLPEEPYEAAQVDGASGWQKFIYITVPALSPLMVLVLSMRYLAVLPVFEHIWMMTQGGPAMKTEVLMTFIFRQSFGKGMFGYGSAASYVIVVVQMALLVLQTKAIQKLRA